MKRSLLWFGGFSAAFAVAVAFVFWGTWSCDVSFIQPDCPASAPAGFLASFWRGFCNGGSLVPFDLSLVLGGPYVWQELRYALGAYLAALGAVYYLKGRNLPDVACYGAGAAYGLMGYNFTLFSAGHLGWFVYLMSGPFCFGLIDRCVRKGKWTNWFLLGGILAWSSARQPDLWLMFTLMAFAYGLFKVILKSRNAAAGRKAAFLLRTAAGVAVTAVTLAAAGCPQLVDAIFVQTANREKQISSSTGNSAAGTAEKSVQDAAAEREKRYIFCTNWSLPPDETVEFFLADANGGSSDPRVSPRNPYRGRIGMQAAPGVWQPYRQHSIYMGFLTMLFAIAGIAFWLNGMRPSQAAAGDGCVLRNRAEIAFWIAMAVLSLFCAFGCFTPFYRLVFALPAGDCIRCPVKFVHLLEWCIAVLSGFGIAAILESRAARNFPRVAVAVLAVLAAGNAANLAAVDSRYCAIDPTDLVAIAVARDTGSTSLAIVGGARGAISGEEYVFADRLAFQNNARLKDAVAKREYIPCSYWNFRGGKPVKVPRERAGFALLKSSGHKPQKEPAGPCVPGAAAVVSLAFTLAVCAAAIFKCVRKGGLP